MPAPGIAARMSLNVTPLGMKPPPAVKLPGWNLNARMMIVRTGMATFHQVMPLFTLLNRRIARKLMPVKMAIRMIVTTKPVCVTLPTPVPPLAFGLNSPCQ